MFSVQMLVHALMDGDMIAGWSFGGCTVLDVTVEHPVYGEITAPLQLSCRRDVDEFVRKMLENAAQPLSLLTDGIHAHRLSVPDEDAFERVCAALRKKGMLLED